MIVSDILNRHQLLSHVSIVYFYVHTFQSVQSIVVKFDLVAQDFGSELKEKPTQEEEQKSA